MFFKDVDDFLFPLLLLLFSSLELDLEQIVLILTRTFEKKGGFGSRSN